MLATDERAVVTAHLWALAAQFRAVGDGAITTGQPGGLLERFGRDLCEAAEYFETDARAIEGAPSPRPDRRLKLVS